MTQNAQQNDGLNILRDSIGIAVNHYGIGGKRKVSLDNVEVDADKDRLALQARILQCEEYDAITRLYANMRAYMAAPLKGVALPTMFKRSVYLIPLASVPAVEQTLGEFQTTLTGLVANLKAVYFQRIEEDRLKLREKFSEAHYPSINALDDTFKITWRYISVAPSAQLEQVSAEVYRQEVARVQTEVRSMGEELKRSLREGAYELVKHIADRLTNDVNGDKRILRVSAVNNLVNFLTTFDTKNIMGDRELSDVLVTLRRLLAGVDPKDLRTDDALRTAVKAKIDEVLPVLDELVQSGGRMITLPDDGPEETPDPTPTPVVPIAEVATCKKHKGESKPCAKCRAESQAKRARAAA